MPYWDEASYHVVLVVGYDDESIIINDPFFDGNEVRVLNSDFFKAWGKEHNYMAIIKKKKD